MISARFALWARQTNRPVLSMVRDATHTAPVQEPMLYALVNVTPLRASRSRLGVFTSVSPSAWIVSWHWSSAKIKRILGFPWAAPLAVESIGPLRQPSETVIPRNHHREYREHAVVNAFTAISYSNNL